MTARMPAGHDAFEAEPARPGSVEARASLVLKILAGVNFAGIVLAQFPPPLPTSLLLTLTFNLSAAGLAVLEVVVARALDHRRPWAVAVVRPLLVVLAASGLAALLAGLAGLGGVRVRMPFETAFAIWALLGPRDATLVRRRDGRGLRAVAASVLLIGSMLFGKPVFGWGGLLDVHKSDFHASIAASCTTPGAGRPRTISVAYNWSWDRPGVLPNGLDVLVIGWSGSDPQGSPLYYFDTAPEPGRGIYSGRRDYPSADMAEQISSSVQARSTWGVELGEQGLRPGSVQLQLVRARDAPPGSTPLVITASYVHLGVWSSDPVSVTCPR